MIFDNDAKTSQQGKGRIFNKQRWETAYPHAKKKKNFFSNEVKLLSSTPHSKINSK